MYSPMRLCLYQFLCIYHVWWAIIKIYLLTYLLIVVVIQFIITVVVVVVVVILLAIHATEYSLTSPHGTGASNCYNVRTAPWSIITKMLERVERKAARGECCCAAYEGDNERQINGVTTYGGRSQASASPGSVGRLSLAWPGRWHVNALCRALVSLAPTDRYCPRLPHHREAAPMWCAARTWKQSSAEVFDSVCTARVIQLLNSAVTLTKTYSRGLYTTSSMSWDVLIIFIHRYLKPVENMKKGKENLTN